MLYMYLKAISNNDMTHQNANNLYLSKYVTGSFIHFL